MADIEGTFLLPKASRYPFPENGDLTLPLIYGDFLSPLAIPNDHEDGGFLPAVQVDRLTWMYVLNARPIPATPRPQIYYNDVFQADNPAVYTFFPSLDIAGIGQPVAAVQLHVNPANKPLSWRGYGTADASGELIDNPVLAVYDAFSTMAGWTLNDFDLAMGAETFRAFETFGVQMRFIFNQEKSFREWLVEIFRCYHTDVWMTEAGKVAISVDRGIFGLPVQTPYRVHAQTDLEGTEDDVEFEVDERNICNSLTVKRRLKWTTLDYTDAPVVEYARSTSVYNTRLHEEVELPALYTDSHGLIWVQAFFQRYAYLPALVRFTVRGLGLIEALPGRYLGFIWPWFGWTEPRLLKVLNQELVPSDDPSIRFECFDCQRTVTDAVTFDPVPITSVRTRPRHAEVPVDLTPPGPASNLVATGSYRRIVLTWTPPTDLDYDHTEIWAAVTNNRANAIFIRNGGYKGTACEETFDVGDGESSFVWLMTVDTAGNGANGGSGPAGGQWFPASPTAGIFAAAALVDTPGIEPNAVSDLYASTLNFTGVALGPTAMAVVTAPASPQTGYLRFHGVAHVQIASLCTLVLEIRQGSFSGPVSGQNIIPNILTVPIDYPFICQGESTTPVWGTDYGMSAQVFNQSGGQVPFTVVFAGMSLNHVKR